MCSVSLNWFVCACVRAFIIFSIVELLIFILICEITHTLIFILFKAVFALVKPNNKNWSTFNHGVSNWYTKFCIMFLIRKTNSWFAVQCNGRRKLYQLSHRVIWLDGSTIPFYSANVRHYQIHRYISWIEKSRHFRKNTSRGHGFAQSIVCAAHVIR